MVPNLFFYQLLLVALIWLCVMLHWAWPGDRTTCPTTPEPTPRLPKRHGSVTERWLYIPVPAPLGMQDVN
jgi:hypothetical protein